MNGRFHLYQGYRPEEVVAPVRLAGLLGAETMIATNATGSLDPAIAPGSPTCSSIDEMPGLSMPPSARPAPRKMFSTREASTSPVSNSEYWTTMSEFAAGKLSPESIQRASHRKHRLLRAVAAKDDEEHDG